VAVGAIEDGREAEMSTMLGARVRSGIVGRCCRAGLASICLMSAVVLFAPTAEAGVGPVIGRVSVRGSVSAPTVVVTGTGFGTEPVGSAANCAATGENFASLLYLQDVTQGWTAGRMTATEDDCIGLVVTSYTATEIDFTFGSFYGTGGGYTLADGDQYSMHVANAHSSATVHYPTITSVALTGTETTPTITIKGTNFGTEPPGTPIIGDTGDNFGTALWFRDDSVGWDAGYGPDSNQIGLVVSSYTPTRIVFQFGSFYNFANVFVLHSGDSYSMNVLGTSLSGVASYPTVKATGTLNGVVTGTVKFTTALTNTASDAPITYKFTGTLSGLTGSTTQKTGTITGATLTATGTLPARTDCDTFLSDNPLAAKITVKYQADAVYLANTAVTFASSTLQNLSPVTVGLSGATLTGSFTAPNGNGSSGNLIADQTILAINTACAAKGLKTLTFNGTNGPSTLTLG
jgi:hypothetical protein